MCPKIFIKFFPLSNQTNFKIQIKAIWKKKYKYEMSFKNAI